MADSEQPQKQQRTAKPKSIAQVLEERSPWKPTPYEQRDVLAIQRVAAGAASADEQRIAFAWIIKSTGINDEPYRPGHADDTNYALGMQKIGRQLIKFLKLNLSQLKGGEHGEHG